MKLHSKQQVVSKILETTCYTHMHQISKTPPKDALFIFDIDEVLIHAKDQVLRPPHKGRWLHDYIDSKYPPEEAKYLSGFIWSHYQVDLVDPLLPEITENLVKSDAYAIALTAGWNGSLGHTENHCDLRVNILKEHGIDFSKSFDIEKELFFEDLTYCGKTASFKDGVTFACMMPKHLVLDALLKEIDFSPAEIHFIDDHLPNLKGMENYCLEQGLDFYGYHYIGVEDKETEPLNEERAHLQYQTVLTTKKWLSDDEADEILRKR